MMEAWEQAPFLTHVCPPWNYLYYSNPDTPFRESGYMNKYLFSGQLRKSIKSKLYTSKDTLGNSLGSSGLGPKLPV